MANEPILILESDPEAEQQLNGLLSTAGFQVYAADRVQSLLNAVKATRFPVVIVDASTPEMTPGRIAEAILQAQPDTMVMFSSATLSTTGLVSMMRGGGCDVLSKPYEAAEVVERVRTLLRRRSDRRKRAREWQRRAKAAEHALEELRSTTSASPLPHHYVEFGEYALQQFLEIERRSMDLERKVASLTRATDASQLRVDAWIAHDDADFARGVLGLGNGLLIDFAAPFSTGGEVLDKISANPPAILVLGDQLPDIPGEFVVETVKSAHPSVHVVLVSGWGTPAKRVALVSGTGQPMERPMDTAEGLVAVLREARERCVDTSVGREFAAEFKRRHEGFLRRLAELKSAEASR